MRNYDKATARINWTEIDKCNQKIDKYWAIAESTTDSKIVSKCMRLQRYWFDKKYRLMGGI